MSNSDSSTSAHHQSQPGPGPADEEDMIDLREVFTRLGRSLPATLGLAFLGLAVGALVFLASNRLAPVGTAGRVTFSFKGFDRGLYPDGSKFLADDLCAPDLIADALKRLAIDGSEALQSEIRAAISVDGIVPLEIVKQRDKIRAAGQTPPPYVPDEYVLTLTRPRSLPLNNLQCERLLNEIVTGYRAKFQRTYAALPVAFGNAFETLREADYLEYELILNDEISNIVNYLTPLSAANPSFRAGTTNLSFGDLLKETHSFAHIRMFETLGQVQVNGVSKNRQTAMVKMDYYLKTLNDRERRALADEEVVQALLAKTQDRAQSYVLGVKSQASQPRSDAPVLDQGLIDSLLANDSYSFLVHRALEAGLEVKRVQSDKAELVNRRTALLDFIKGQNADQTAIVAQIDKSLKDLETSYKALIGHIRKTLEDYNRQQFADAIRVSANIVTAGIMRKLAIFGAIGFFIGAAAGMGLGLLGVQVGRKS